MSKEYVFEFNGTKEEQKAQLSAMGLSEREDRNGTIAYSILNSHNTKPDSDKMRIKFVLNTTIWNGIRIWQL